MPWISFGACFLLIPYVCNDYFYLKKSSIWMCWILICFISTSESFFHLSYMPWIILYDAFFFFVCLSVSIHFWRQLLQKSGLGGISCVIFYSVWFTFMIFYLFIIIIVIIILLFWVMYPYTIFFFSQLLTLPHFPFC